MFTWSLSWKVPVEWVAKEMKAKEKLDYNPVETFVLVEDHQILRFHLEGDYAAAFKGGLWFVAGQLMAMDAWEPDFIPEMKMVIWLHLPDLPMEFWMSSLILASC